MSADVCLRVLDAITRLHKIFITANLELLHNIDILVDGRFREDLKDLTLQFRGSSNQRIIDVKKSFEKGEVVIWEGLVR